MFPTLLSIIPAKIPAAYRFLHPYIRSLSNPPRHTIVHTATNNPAFASMLNNYVLRLCKYKHHYSAILSFWAGVMTEAVSGMMDKSKSGRKSIQMQNDQDVILRLLPVLNEGLAIEKVPELHLGCYMLLSVMATKGGLADNVLTAMMEAVVQHWSQATIQPGLVCLSVLAQQRSPKPLSKPVVKVVMKVANLPSILLDLSKKHRMDRLANGLCLGVIDRMCRKGESEGFPLIESVLENNLLRDAQVTVVTKALLLAAQQLNDESDASGHVRKHLATTLVKVAALPGHSGVVVRGAIEKSGVDMDELELKLQTTIRPKELPAAQSEDVEMQDVHDSKPTGPNFAQLLEHLPKRTVDEVSFLSHKQSHIFDGLRQAFIASTSSEEHLKEFDSTPILQRDNAVGSALYFTFYMNIWCGPQPVLTRIAALTMTTRRLKQLKLSEVDLQAMVPYLVVALHDQAKGVRKAAAEALKALSGLYPSPKDAKKKGDSPPKWGFESIYGSGEETADTKWLPADGTPRLLQELLVPALEECVLDNNHVLFVLSKALNGSKGSKEKKNDPGHLPQALRSGVLSYLGSHTINSPLYTVKSSLLAALNQVKSVAGHPRTKVLLPVLQQWASLSSLEAERRCAPEQINVQQFDDSAVAVVVASDKDGLDFLSSIIRGEVAKDRESLISAAFTRLRSLWSSLRGDTVIQIAQLLLDISQGKSSAPTAPAAAMDLLRSLPLTSEVLAFFMTQLPTATKLADTPPASKRRRISHEAASRSHTLDREELAASIRKVTFVLQLVDGSEAAQDPQLLGSLFNTLTDLQQFGNLVESELPYLQTLILSSLLTIVKACKADPTLVLEKSAIREDLLVDCIQKSSSPQVQNAALLLVASLANTVPELVLHSVMPIFTFMSNSVLRQSDEYSSHVISQTIRDVIPPLIKSLRKEKGNPVIGAATLLSSFVAAYEHVPAYRRKGLFISLVQTLGPDEFLFALLAMLVYKYHTTDAIKDFAKDLSGNFSAETQLQTCLKYIDLVGDVLKPKPTISKDLLVPADFEKPEPQNVALNLLTLLPGLLSQPRLVSQAAKILEQDDMDAARVRDLYSNLLARILALAELQKSNKSFHGACGDVLQSLLGLLSTAEFVKSVESLLDRPNEDLRLKILRSFEVRIEQENRSDASARTAMLSFLPQLTAIIRESTDDVYKLTAVACVDKIAEKYGKKDLEGVAAAAETIAGDHCLGQSDSRVRIMALLCLASLVDILREGVVAILPKAIPSALAYMEDSMEEGQKNAKLQDAGFSFVTALVQHVPYMMTGSYLDRVLSICNASAEADLGDSLDASRVQCLRLLARQVDPKNMLAALEKNWERAASSGPLVSLPRTTICSTLNTNSEKALQEYLDTLSTAIEKHPKSTITKHSATLARIFLRAFDLRREHSSSISTSSLGTLEPLVNSVALKMVYKFNDSTFRPIFSQLIDWSTSLPKKDRAGRTARLQSVYAFTTLFFTSLKSIVTSYATYILDNAASTLSSTNISDPASRELWTRVLSTLTQCFEHDQDDFWQSPSHIKAIAPVLDAQFSHAPSMPPSLLTQHLIPCLVELAAAAVSAEHHKLLNSNLMRRLKDGNAKVRLAAVKAQQALTTKLGEEWLAMLPEMLPVIGELQDDEDEEVERETARWIVGIEGVLGESLEGMLQ